MKLRKKDSNKPTESRKAPHVSRPDTYRYHADRSDEGRSQSSRGQVKRRPQDKVSLARRFERMVTAAVLFVIAGSIAYLFWLDVTPRVQVSGNLPGDVDTGLHSIEEYEAGANKILTRSVFSRTKVTLDTNKFAREMQTRFPELASVTMTIPLTGHKPVVDIVLKDPKAVLEVNSVAYVVDGSGLALLLLKDIPETSQKGLAALPYVDDQTAFDATIGQQITTSETISFILQTVNQYKKKTLDIQKIVLPSQQANEVHVYTDGVDYYAKYVPSRSAREQVGSFIAVKERLEEQGRAPAAYIDARVSGKVFYK